MTECPRSQARTKPWTAKRALLLGFVIGAMMCCPVVALYLYNHQREYEVSAGAFVACFLTLTVGVPLGTTIWLFSRIRRFAAGMLYCVGGALGLAAVWQIAVVLDHGSIDLSYDTFYFGVLSACLFVHLFILWLVVLGISRLFRVRASERATAACSSCGYDLTGNTSGVCPECGKKLQSAGPECGERI